MNGRPHDQHAAHLMTGVLNPRRQHATLLLSVRCGSASRQVSIKRDLLKHLPGKPTSAMRMAKSRDRVMHPQRPSPRHMPICAICHTAACITDSSICAYTITCHILLVAYRARSCAVSVTRQWPPTSRLDVVRTASGSRPHAAQSTCGLAKDRAEKSASRACIRYCNPYCSCKSPVGVSFMSLLCISLNRPLYKAVLL